MKKAVTKPQAMKAPILGITIPAIKAPNFCSFSLIISIISFV
jgi:hypothetical protein